MIKAIFSKDEMTRQNTYWTIPLLQFNAALTIDFILGRAFPKKCIESMVVMMKSIGCNLFTLYKISTTKQIQKKWINDRGECGVEHLDFSSIQAPQYHNLRRLMDGDFEKTSTENEIAVSSVEGVGEDIMMRLFNPLDRLGPHIIIIGFDDTESAPDMSPAVPSIESIAVVLRNKLLEHFYERTIYSDHKTGLFNSRKLEMDKCSFESSGFICMVDIDHFKMFNETHGHIYADEVLELVASVIAKTVREFDGDKVYRFGGEEFCIFLNGLQRNEHLIAASIADRVRIAISKIKLKENCLVTVSIGLTYVSCADVKFYQELADQALYQAKNLGRNRTVFVCLDEDGNKVFQTYNPKDLGLFYKTGFPVFFIK